MYPRVLHYFVERNGVIEEAVGDHAARGDGRVGAVQSGKVGAADLLGAVQVPIQLHLVDGLGVGQVALEERLDAVVDEDVPGNAVVQGDEQVAVAVGHCGVVVVVVVVAIVVRTAGAAAGDFGGGCGGSFCGSSGRRRTIHR